MDQSTHDNLDRDEPNSPGSNRTFGLVMAGALALVGALNFYHSGRLWRWELTFAAPFLAAAWLAPRLLHPLNRLWMKLGLVLHRIVNPIVMGFSSTARFGQPGS